MQNSWEKSSENVNMTLRYMTNIKLTKESIKILGVICKKIWYNKKNEDEFNFCKTVKIICNVIKLWHMRKLSLEGKIAIFNLKVLFRTYNFITKRITRSKNIFWNKNTNRCKTGKIDISSLLSKRDFENISFTTFTSIDIFISNNVFASGYSFCYNNF